MGNADKPRVGSKIPPEARSEATYKMTVLNQLTALNANLEKLVRLQLVLATKAGVSVADLRKALGAKLEEPAEEPKTTESQPVEADSE